MFSGGWVELTVEEDERERVMQQRVKEDGASSSVGPETMGNKRDLAEDVEEDMNIEEIQHLVGKWIFQRGVPFFLI